MVDDGLNPISCSSRGWRGTDAGGNLKETGTTHWNSPNAGATNSSGFKALGAGYRITNGSSVNLMVDTYFWSSTEADLNKSWYRRLYYGIYQIQRDRIENSGFSVRCLKD